MPRVRRPEEGPSEARDDLPQNPWQLLGYALRLIVDKVLGDWDKTVQLWLLGVLPILLVCSGVTLVVGAIDPSPQNWGIILGGAMSAALGMPATRGVVRYVRARRQRRLTAAATPLSDDGTPTREGG